MNKNKFIKWFAAILTTLVFAYLVGPVPPKFSLNEKIDKMNNIQLDSLEMMINKNEQSVPSIKEDNQARIIWYDSTKKEKTPYSIVYLHGFTGSQMDGSPAHIEFAKRYGCNLYLARLYGHGIESDNPLLDLTPENYFESAKEAVRIGEQLGDKVIIMATSTGGTLALPIAADNPEIAGLILYSPNIDVYDKASFILTKPWGLQIAKLVKGGDFITSDDPPIIQKYWQTKYRVEAAVTLKSLINAEMTEKTFAKVHQPVFVGYYYKNDREQDHTVSVKRILEMFNELGTPDSLKRKVAFPDVGAHPIACSLVSKDVPHVLDETYKFAEEVLHLTPVIK